VITLQKFIAELRMLQTRAKELGLPITANMIGRAIEVCEGERDATSLQSDGSKSSKLGHALPGGYHSIAREGRNEKEQNKCATRKDGENTSAVTREAEEDWAR